MIKTSMIKTATYPIAWYLRLTTAAREEKG